MKISFSKNNCYDHIIEKLRYQDVVNKNYDVILLYKKELDL